MTNVFDQTRPAQANREQALVGWRTQATQRRREAQHAAQTSDRSDDAVAVAGRAFDSRHLPPRLAGTRLGRPSIPRQVSAHRRGAGKGLLDAAPCTWRAVENP